MDAITVAPVLTVVVAGQGRAALMLCVGPQYYECAVEGQQKHSARPMES